MLNKYRLELHWGDIAKKDTGVVFLNDAYFSGPVLSNANKIRDNDNIRLDFTPQFSKIVTSYYFVDLVWSTVTYKENKVRLGGAVLRGNYIYELNELTNSDYIIIDTSAHEEDKHLYSLVYEATLVNIDGKEKS